MVYKLNFGQKNKHNLTFSFSLHLHLERESLQVIIFSDEPNERRRGGRQTSKHLFKN